MRAPRQQNGSIEAIPAASGNVARTRARVGVLVLIAIYAIARVRNPAYWDPRDDLNLAVHEAGHLAFSMFGDTMTVLAAARTALTTGGTCSSIGTSCRGT